MQMKKEKKVRKDSGITLIALVITIVVLLILAGVSIATLTGDSGIITQAGKAKTATELTGIKEEIEVGNIKAEEKKHTRRYMTTKEVDKEIKDMPEQYKGKIGLYRDEVIYLGEEEEKTAKTAKEYGYRIINMTEDEFKYYIELGIVEDSIVEKKNNKIGRELQTADFPDSITIGDNTYSNGWYLIGNYTDEEKQNNTYGDQFEKLGIKDITHAPYIANYETGGIFSVDGMIMYKAEIPVHTFQDGNFKLINAISYVGDTSTKTEDYYGNLYSTALYQGPVDGGGGVYSDNNGKLQYDENGALILDQDNAIPVLEVNQKYKINDSYSINVTVEGKINYEEAHLSALPATIVALSDVSCKYICWIGVHKGYLQIHSYQGLVGFNIDYEVSKKGFISIDISKYENQKMNIQVVGERGKETKVYINGEHVGTFESGDEQYTYDYTTIGDLRVGRNLKFTGKIHNFAIYGVALNDKEIQENYEESKKYGVE